MDLPILRYLDVLIGFTLIMILACTAVTAITQLLLTSSFMRSRNLRKGLADLIAQIDPETLQRDAEYIADRLQRHPLAGRIKSPLARLAWWLRERWRASNGKLPLPCLSAAGTLQREEVALFLLDWANDSGTITAQDGRLGRLPAELAAVRDKLKAAALKTGIADPDATLKLVREMILANERERPGDAAQQWKAQALATAAQSDFVARIFAWYDNATARMIGHFTLTAKVVTAFVALFLCVLTQLDAVAIGKRLWQDDKYRNSMVAQAKVYWDRQQSLETEAQELTGERKAAAQSLAAELKTMHDHILKDIAPVEATGVQLSIPWNSASAFFADMRQRPGILLSWILITLGAPFWYDLLKNLLGLRSLLAQKDDVERGARDATAVTPPSREEGERGDLKATGAAA